MKIKALLIIGVGVAIFSLFWSDEHVACRDLDYDYSIHSVTQLGVIASSCRNEGVTSLYYNRAYFADLFETREVGFFEPNLSYLSNSHRLYMGMIEAFAPQWYPNEKERIAFLNEQYELASSVAEIKLRHYDQYAALKRSASQ